MFEGPGRSKVYDRWHTSDGLLGTSCVFVEVKLDSSAAVGLVGSMGLRCFSFADFALERC